MACKVQKSSPFPEMQNTMYMMAANCCEVVTVPLAGIPSLVHLRLLPDLKKQNSFMLNPRETAQKGKMGRLLNTCVIFFGSVGD